MRLCAIYCALLPRSLGPILCFAVIGTLVSTAVLAALLQLGGSIGWIDPSLFGGIGSGSGIRMCVLFATLTSATDAVSTLAVLSSREVDADATLQSVLFGESVLNDAVAIVRAQTRAHARAQTRADTREGRGGVGGSKYPHISQEVR